MVERDEHTKIDISKSLHKELMLLAITEGKYLFRLADEIFRLGLQQYKQSGVAGKNNL